MADNQVVDRVELKRAYDAGEIRDESHIMVEYDLSFYGGDYSKVGRFAYVPSYWVFMLEVEAAFNIATGIDPVHIVSYNLDEIYFYNEERKEWIGEWLVLDPED